MNTNFHSQKLSTNSRKDLLDPLLHTSVYSHYWHSFHMHPNTAWVLENDGKVLQTADHRRENFSQLKILKTLPFIMGVFLYFSATMHCMIHGLLQRAHQNNKHNKVIASKQRFPTPDEMANTPTGLRSSAPYPVTPVPRFSQTGNNVTHMILTMWTIPSPILLDRCR